MNLLRDNHLWHFQTSPGNPRGGTCRGAAQLLGQVERACPSPTQRGYCTVPHQPSRNTPRPQDGNGWVGHWVGGWVGGSASANRGPSLPRRRGNDNNRAAPLRSVSVVVAVGVGRNVLVFGVIVVSRVLLPLFEVAEMIRKWREKLQSEGKNVPRVKGAQNSGTAAAKRTMRPRPSTCTTPFLFLFLRQS